MSGPPIDDHTGRLGEAGETRSPDTKKISPALRSIRGTKELFPEGARLLRIPGRRTGDIPIMIEPVNPIPRECINAILIHWYPVKLYNAPISEPNRSQIDAEIMHISR